MTPIEIEKALAEIVVAKEKECKSDFLSLSKDKATERKALAMICGIYDMCLNGGLLWKASDRSAQIKLKSTRIEVIAQKCEYTELVELIKSSSTAELERITSALYGEVFMSTVAKKYRDELEYAKDTGNISAEIDAKIKLSAVEEILTLWKVYRCEQGLYPDMPR